MCPAIIHEPVILVPTHTNPLWHSQSLKKSSNHHTRIALNYFCSPRVSLPFLRAYICLVQRRPTPTNGRVAVYSRIWENWRWISRVAFQCSCTIRTRGVARKNVSPYYIARGLRRLTSPIPTSCANTRCLVGPRRWILSMERYAARQFK